jgi:hypothetical protein
MNSKKVEIEKNLQLFFEQFNLKNKLIFSKLINTIKNEENKMVGSLDDIKRKVKLFIGEETILKNADNFLPNIKKIDGNFRKSKNEQN